MRNLNQKKMRTILFSVMFLFLLAGCQEKTDEQVNTSFADGETVKISKMVLQDKIKGGWAGQVIGCTYGGPPNFSGMAP
jgi:uncharacterized lipoprotein YehR (DUF1307 family)